MNWYYAENGESKGPVAQELFDRMVQEGIIRIDTLVWHEGMGDWLPYGKARVAAVAAAEAGVPGTAAPDAGARDHRCCECDRTFPESDMVSFEGRWVCAGCKPQFFQRIREGAVLPGEMVYAGFWIRFGAKFIDGVVLTMALLVIMAIVIGLGLAFYAAKIRGDGHGPAGLGLLATFGPMIIQIVLQLVYSGMVILYNAYFIGRYGATPGKMACGLRVVTADGQRVTYGRAFGRAFAELLSRITCSIGYIIAAFDDEKRALHDHVCSTRVIRK
jgi:uncharacterized RDD family membrane protein YckC